MPSSSSTESLHADPKLAIRTPILCLYSAVLLLAAGLTIYSQTQAFSLDEGFHLLAAQLINRGETPYIDFCFPQPPLNAYWNAALMRMFGDGWRSPHVFAAVFVAAAVLLTAEFVFGRFPISRWRVTAAVLAASIVGLSISVVQFGTVQAYGISLFLIVAAFRAALPALDRTNLFWPLAAGLLSGAAAGCSLLTTPVAPVLLAWIFAYSRVGSRWTKSAVLLLGAAIPFTPVLWLYIRAPGPVLFNVIEYQVIYRRVNWGDAGAHDFDVLTSWVDSSPALIVAVLAMLGVLFLRALRTHHQHERAEFFLAAWLAGSLTVFLCLAHPTFERYFLFTMPFYAVLAPIGLYELASRFGGANRPFWPAVLVLALLSLGLAKTLFDDRTAYKWRDYEQIARKVDQVTAPGAALWADEVIYFLTRRVPPRGMEFSYSHKLELPTAMAASLHIVSQREIDREARAGAFATVATCADDDEIERLGLERIYAHRADVSECAVFWGKR